MKTLIVSIAILVFFSFNLFAQHPFQSLGVKDIEVLTFSKGKFNEFFDNDSIVQIGSVLFNTISNKVVAFVKVDTTYSEATLKSEITSRWLSPDPLAAKYPFQSPYNFVSNSPIFYIDPDGREVKAANESAKTTILNTLTKTDMAFVKFDKDGIIDKTLLNQANSNSGNLAALQQLVNDSRTFEIKIDNKIVYKNEKGDITNKEMGPVTKAEDYEPGPFDVKTGEQGWLGVTQTPGSEPEKYNSPDNTIKITVNSGLSEEGQAENLAHEAYGHAYLYSKGEPHMHKVEGMKETNEKLRDQIPARIDETEKNYKENHKEVEKK